MEKTTFVIRHKESGDVAAKLTFDRDDNYFFNSVWSDVDMDPLLANDEMAMEMISFAIVDGAADSLSLVMLENGEWTWESIAEQDNSDYVLKIEFSVTQETDR